MTKLSNLGLEELAQAYKAEVAACVKSIRDSYDKYLSTLEEGQDPKAVHILAASTKQKIKSTLVKEKIDPYPNLMRHISAHIAETWEYKTSTSLEFLTKNCSNDFDMGIWLIATSSPRGVLVKDQNKGTSTRFCALVPIILAAFKDYHKVPYSYWKNHDIRLLVDESLAEAMLYTPDTTMTTEDILAAVDTGLTVKTGTKAGEKKSPLTTYLLTGLKGTCFEGAPTLATIMYGQTWCAHPSNRNEYMILDPSNWDSMPAPLIESKVLVDTTIEYSPW